MAREIPATWAGQYEAWKIRRAECLQIGHVFKGDTCQQCGAAKHGNAKHVRAVAK